MEFFVLGPLEVRVRAGAARSRWAEAAGRACRAPRPCSAPWSRADRLIDDLWGAAPPARPRRSCRTRSRASGRPLGASTIETVAPGYVLEARSGIDRRASIRAPRSRRAPVAAPASVSGRCGTLSLSGAGRRTWTWPSRASSRAEIARLDELRLTALEDRLEAEIELGLHDACQPELEALAAREPARERLRTAADARAPSLRPHPARA